MSVTAFVTRPKLQLGSSVAGKSAVVTFRRHGNNNAGVTCCPACGHPIPLDDIAGSLPPMQRHIYELIRDAGTQGITRVSIEQLIYANERGGGPETNSISVLICQHINPKLRGLGLIIKSRQYRYRLERITP